MKKLAMTISALTVLMASGSAISAPSASPGMDPFRPFPAVETFTPNAAAGGVKLRLSAVLISPYRRQAVINHRLVAVGGRIGSARILEIDPRGVLVLRQGKRLWLQLIRGRVLRPGEGGT